MYGAQDCWVEIIFYISVCSLEVYDMKSIDVSKVVFLFNKIAVLTVAWFLVLLRL